MKVFVGLLNWNRCDDLRRLIKSVLKDLSGQSNYNFEVAVIDNASTDKSIQMLDLEFPDLKKIINNTKLGGSGGFNTVLRYAATQGFDFAWLLDNDAEVLPGAFQGLMFSMESDQKIALVGSKVLHRDDSSIISELGAKISAFSTFPIPQFSNIPNLDLKAQIIDVDYVAICSALVRVSLLNTFGALDERFFLMWDDMEWGMRIRNHGYRVVATSLSEVVHPGFSERTLSPLFVYYAWRNHLYFIAVTYSGIRRIFYLCYISGLLHAAKINAQYVNKNFPFVKAYNLAFRDFCEAKFGKMDRSIEAFSCAGSGDLFKDKDIEALFGTNNVVLLSADRSVAVVKLTIDVLKGRFPNTRFIILVNYSRKYLFRWYNHNDLWIRKGIFRDFYLYKQMKINKVKSIFIFENLPIKILFFFNKESIDCV